MIKYRKMTVGDIPAGLMLCRSAGWNQLSRDWELFLKLSPDGCLVATDEGKVVGTVTTIRYEDHFAWIGMVLVDPEKQRQGIGMKLLKESMDILKDEKTIKLDATPSGREVYLKLDFIDEYKISRMHISEVDTTRLSASHARPVLENDLPRIFEFDKDVFGADRRAVLEWIWKSAPQHAFLLETNNELKGYCFGRPGHNFTQVGPVVAENFEGARDLASASLRICSGHPGVVDVLYHTPEWVNWISGLGFSEQRSLMRMHRGANQFPGEFRKQFAILGPEFG